MKQNELITIINDNYIIKKINIIICKLIGHKMKRVNGIKIHRCKRCGIEIDSFFVTLDNADY